MPIHHVENQSAGDGDKETYKVAETTRLSPWESDARFTVVGQPLPRLRIQPEVRFTLVAGQHHQMVGGQSPVV